jgi:crotonobetainyl-CoA:carnitine CoA-transferase CaiB-like acyl-CoA transferase
LLEQNVGLVVTSISCFGATGPYAKYNANDLTLMAMGGWMSPQGDAGEAPLYAGEPLLSYLTGEHAALGTALALLESEASGVGQEVEVSMFEVAANSLLFDTVGYSYTGGIRKRVGNAFKAPFFTLPAKDGAVSMQSIEEWDLFWTVLTGGEAIPGNPAREQDPVQRERLVSEVVTCLATIDKREFFATGQMLRFLVGEVFEIDELLTSPQFVDRDYFTMMDHPELGTLPYTGAPARFSASPWTLHEIAPRLGAHNAAVYGTRLGIGPVELEYLALRGVI